MKKILLISVLIILSGVTKIMAQSKTFYSKIDLVNKFHTIEDLEDVNKSALVKLYIARNSELSKVLPFIALTSKPDQKLSDVGVKSSAQNLKILSKYKAIQKKNIQNNSTIINEFTAYADSENLIWSILYMEDIIKKIRLGFKGNF